jgi:holo-[acyl-carrier protein] synthase
MSDIFGIGTDITECLRIAKMIERYGELFINRVYTPEEIHYCQNCKQTTQHFTGRWAAKEAILKSLGTGWQRGITWRDIEVRNKPGGQPVVGVRGGVKEIVERLGVSDILVSISHCHTHAMATAIAMVEKKEPIEE